MRTKNRVEKIVLTVLASVWGLVCLFPIWVLISGTFSLDSNNLTKTFFPNSLGNGLVKCREALLTIDIATATVHTFIYTGITVAGILLVSSLAAYEFTFYRFPLKKLLFGLLMVSMMLPQVLYIIPLYRLVYNMDLSDTFAGISMPMMVSALSVFIMMQFLEDLPASFIESARIDGAGHFQIYGRIVLPLMRNGILTTVVLMFMKIWGQYLWPALVTGQKIKPISVTVANLLNPNFWVDPRVKIAAMLIAMIPPLAIYLVFQRYVIEGITMSGVKG